MRRILGPALVFALASLCVLAAPGAARESSGWRLAFATETPGRRGLDVYVVDVPGGAPIRVAGIIGRNDFSPAWSPDGRRIAYRLDPPRGDESDILVVSARGGKPRKLTRSAGVADWSPAWSPDGRRIAFFSMRGGGRDLWLMNPDGSGKQRLTRDGSLNEYPVWSPDGRRIAFQSARLGEFEIFVMPSGGGKARNLTRHPGRDQWADWSPDGNWIAFMSTRDGSDDVFVVSSAGGDARNLTSTPGLQESHPVWAPNGELTFSRHGDSGPVELWAMHPDGSAARRLATTVEPVFVYDWAPR